MKTIVEERAEKGGWLKGVGKCEVCGVYEAMYNLELNSGSHKECYICWNENDYY